MGTGIVIIAGIIVVWIGWKYYDYKQRHTIHIDPRGYKRNGYGRLVHRDIAYNYLYREGFREGEYTQRFRVYDIHHIDGNKKNNLPSNLQILTREEHKKIHGY